MTKLIIVTILKLLLMEVNLIRHGYNVERRKMYPSNPRNNLVSTVDMAWQKSLENEEAFFNHQPKAKKQEQLQDIQQNYTKAIQAKIQEEALFNKSSFRVMPVHPIDAHKANRSMTNSQMRDSLAEELNNFRDKLKSQTISFHGNRDDRYNSQQMRNQIIDSSENKRKPIQNSTNVSATVFGYNINYQNFKRQSYMSKLLSDRLQPYLSKSIEKKTPRHSSIAINSPVPIYYE